MQLITAIDPATITASNFQLDRKTRFVIHGFIDEGEGNWLLDMCRVGACPSHLLSPSTQVQTLHPDILGIG